MAKINILIAVASVALAVGQVPGKLRYTLIPAQGDPIVQDSDLPTAEFDDVAPGDYTVTASRVDSLGVIIGTPVSGPITVPVPTPETVDVPVSITLSLA
jgi:hypothetical protein